MYSMKSMSAVRESLLPALFSVSQPLLVPRDLINTDLREPFVELGRSVFLPLPRFKCHSPRLSPFLGGGKNGGAANFFGSLIG